MFCCKLGRLLSLGILNYPNDRTMKKRIEKYLIFIAILTLILLAGCKKEKIPVVSTNEGILNVTESTATSGGNITDDGGAAVTTRGVCWSISSTPTINDNKTTDGAGSGSYSSNISGLSSGETYYIRAYATNSAGTGYGQAILFKTPSQCPGPPIVFTFPPTEIGNTYAHLWAIIYANYSSTLYAWEWGTTESYGYIFWDTDIIVGGDYRFVHRMFGPSQFLPQTLYHYRVKAVNSYGTAYGDDMTFTTISK
jgi:hypothetical protein